MDSPFQCEIQRLSTCYDVVNIERRSMDHVVFKNEIIRLGDSFDAIEFDRKVIIKLWLITYFDKYDKIDYAKFKIDIDDFSNKYIKLSSHNLILTHIPCIFDVHGDNSVPLRNYIYKVVNSSDSNLSMSWTVSNNNVTTYECYQCSLFGFVMTCTKNPSKRMYKDFLKYYNRSIVRIHKITYVYTTCNYKTHVILSKDYIEYDWDQLKSCIKYLKNLKKFEDQDTFSVIVKF